MMMLEFQGAIEMDGQSWAGNTLGQLSILDGVRTTVKEHEEHSTVNLVHAFILQQSNNTPHMQPFSLFVF